MKTILLIISISLFACQNTSSKKELNKPVKNISTTDSSHKSNIDTIALVSNTKISKSVSNEKAGIKNAPVKQEQTRIMSGVTDEELNGKPLLVQMEISKKAYLSNPDTIITELKSIYINSERSFIRSIADDFEHGISVERVSYPTLFFNVELYDDNYATIPYQTLNYSIIKNLDGSFKVN